MTMENSGVTYNLPGTVSAVFFNKADANSAYQALVQSGHTSDDISVLMSDETLHEQQKVYTQDLVDEDDTTSAFGKTRDRLSDAIISFTAMISLPGLGIAISNKLFKKISEQAPSRQTLDWILDTSFPDSHAQSYGSGMREGGIIISVDPRNADEKRTIVNAFVKNNGHDILGDDGYTDLG